MKCARCLWQHRDPAREAVTVYEGHALCGLHLSIRKDEKRDRGEDPWM